MISRDIAKMIDHTLLRPELTTEDVRRECSVARQFQTASVRVRPCDVALAESLLRGSSVAVGTVISFPHGDATTEIKVAEAKRAMDDGAVELDMVLNIGRLRSGETNYVLEDVEAVVRAAHQMDAAVSVIVESCYLSDEEKATASLLCVEAGADSVKTSTGFGSGGYTLHDIQLMTNTVAGRCQVRADGGVRTLTAALALREAGCARFGTSATQAIMEDAQLRFGK